MVGKRPDERPVVRPPDQRLRDVLTAKQFSLANVVTAVGSVAGTIVVVLAGYFAHQAALKEGLATLSTQVGRVEGGSTSSESG